MTHQELIKVIKILQMEHWPYLLIYQADFWCRGSFLLGLLLKLAIAAFGPPNGKMAKLTATADGADQAPK